MQRLRVWACLETHLIPHSNTTFRWIKDPNAEEQIQLCLEDDTAAHLHVGAGEGASLRDLEKVLALLTKCPLLSPAAILQPGMWT